MPTDLTSQDPANTFGQLLHVSDGLTASFKVVYDGDGTASVLELSTGGVRVSDFTVTGAIVLSGLSTATVTSTDKVIIQDVDASDTVKTVTAQSIADLAAAGDAWSDPVDADIIPDADGTRDLGSTATRFAETYTDALAVTNNITVGGTVDGRDIATDGTKLDSIEANADVTDETNVVAALDGATLTAVTVSGTDKVIVQDVDDSNTIKTVTAQSIADLGAAGAGDAWSDPVDSDIVPDADGTRDLGTTTTRFAETYTDALDVTNNITVGGTVDGRDIATDGTKLDGIEANATADQTTEEIQDAAWAAVSSGTQTLITVTYQDATNNVDFVVDNDLSNYSNATSGFITGITGEPLSDLSDVTITTIASGELLKWNGSAWINNTLAEAGIAASSHTHATSDITSGTFADARIAESNVTQHQAALTITESQISDLAHTTQEQVEDWVGAMFSLNTETGITATYQDIDGTIDLVVSDTTVAGDSGSTGITPGDTLTIAGGTNATTAMSGDTLTINVDDAFISNTGDVGTGVYDFGGATSFEIPNSATPTVNADGEIAVATTVANFSAGVLKYYSGEEMGVVAMPIAEFTAPTNGHVVAYNSTNDEFELVAQSGGGISAGQSLLYSLIRI